MANQEQVEILRQGVEVWNKWREDNPDVKIDLSGANFSLENLIGINFDGADISSAILIGAYLNRAILRNANLSSANLSSTNLSHANLICADLIRTGLSGAILSGADITGANLYVTSRDYWKIDGIKCDYVCFDPGSKERTPKDRDFRPGEFEYLYKWRSLNDFERLIERSIEFPPEYKQAGVSILNYFSEILRKKYPESEATVQIKQDGLKISMIIDPAKGEREIIEKTLNDYGLVITGQMPPEQFTDDRFLIYELKNELRIAQHRIESQRELLQITKQGYSQRIESLEEQVCWLRNTVGTAIQSRPVNISPTINVSPSIRQGDENNINAHDVANSTLIAGNHNKNKHS
jgi:hypothetical protein